MQAIRATRATDALGGCPLYIGANATIGHASSSDSSNVKTQAYEGAMIAFVIAFAGTALSLIVQSLLISRRERKRDAMLEALVHTVKELSLKMGVDASDLKRADNLLADVATTVGH